MKLYGYANDGTPIEDIVPLELAEVTLACAPDELRRIAKFLASAADKMEARGADYNHEHLADKDRSFRHSPHFVVANPSA